jgi:hypothetical protein
VQTLYYTYIYKITELSRSVIPEWDGKFHMSPNENILTIARLLPVLKPVSSAIKSAFLRLTSENGQIPARLVPVTDILRSVEVGNLGYHHSHPFVAVNCSSLNSYANFMQICIFFNLPIAYFHGCKIRLILKTRRELKDAPSKQRNSSCNTKCFNNFWSCS